MPIGNYYRKLSPGISGQDTETLYAFLVAQLESDEMLFAAFLYAGRESGLFISTAEELLEAMRMCGGQITCYGFKA